jgi:hypothetical protein
VFAVTTRNKLRSRRHAVSMIWAWGHIRRQLAHTPGMLAYTTGIANLTEFFTLTLWEKEIDMTLFMASEDHRDMMWNTRQWSESFWSMRWKPTKNEVGTWSGIAFSEAHSLIAAKPKYVGPGYLDITEVPEGLRPYLRNITRQSEPNTLPLNAVIGRIPARSPFVVLLIQRTLAAWKSPPATLQFKVCAGLGECLLLVVWKCEAEQEAMALMMALQSKFPEAWAMRFSATDFEIGHWNDLRLRQLGQAPSPIIN